MSSQAIQIHDKFFVPYISAAEIDSRIKEIGASLTEELKGQDALMVGVLNGAFVFMADLLRQCDFNVSVHFLKAKSYEGVESSGTVKVMNADEKSLEGMNVLLVEDIIDTGLTVKVLLEKIWAQHPASVKVITLLHKPEATVHEVQIDHVGFEIPPAFVVGYGLDYDGLGRNLSDILQLQIP
ncbi:MAG: hypoxanthine phosphoribosyltransferase [Saprospiraceae bacterium]|nr:hypoxanthine phosphoribosyltransferase [Saprospiraceae bacterium]